MKKIVAIMLIGVMALAFYACGSKEDKNTPIDENQAYLDSLNIEKVDNYLFKCDYTEYDYDTVSSEFETLYKGGGCSAVRNGDLVGRNFDWKKDKEAYFIIKTPSGNGSYATLGISGAIPELTQKTVESGKWVDAYKTLPLVTLDGINDQGLVCSSLTVPTGESGITTGTNPDGEDLCALMLTRYVLDNASNVDEAVKLLKQRNIYMPNSDAGKQEYQWMLSDPKTTIVIECVDNEMKIIEDEDILTNFYLNGFDKTEQTLPRMPIGIERYNILRDNYDLASTKEGMADLMKSVWYSKKYDTDTVPFWYSDYCKDYGDDSYGTLDSGNFGDPDLSGDQYWKAGDYKRCIMDNSTQYRLGKRNGKTWNTCYTSVYDMKNLTLTVLPQEKNKQYDFKIEK